jgi:peptidoglycan/xylan/chitin deacetylase (PgdA/CDA1 family)
MVPILLYHKVSNFELSGIWITPAQFKHQLKYLYKHKYTTISPNELYSPPKLKVLITFDDGYQSFYSIAFPFLLKYGFKATIFVITGYIGKENLWDINIGKREKHLSLQELKEIKKYNFVIGSHTRTHPDLTKISFQRAKEELSSSKKELEDKLGEEVKFLSYPFGRYNDAIIEIALEVGYTLTFTSNPLVNQKEVVGRMGISLIDQLPQFKVKLNKSSLFYFAEAKKTQFMNFFSRSTWIWKNLNPLTKHKLHANI